MPAEQPLNWDISISNTGPTNLDYGLTKVITVFLFFANKTVS